MRFPEQLHVQTEPNVAGQFQTCGLTQSKHDGGLVKYDKEWFDITDDIMFEYLYRNVAFS